MNHKPGKYKVANLKLAADGDRLIEWAESRMPVLMALRATLREEQAVQGVQDRRLPPRHEGNRGPRQDLRRGREPR
jgi:radical SAM superfamily enzyme